MSRAARAVAWSLALAAGLAAAASAPAPKPTPTPPLAEVLAASKPAEWRESDPAHTLYLDLPAGRVVIELAPAFAPQHVANIEALVRGGYYDGLAFIRSQDNFVAQLGDPDDKRGLGAARATLPPEYTVPIAREAPFDAIPDHDGYAPQVGFSLGLPAGRDAAANEQWLLHCYGAVAVARSANPESGNGSSLYVVIGHAPRQLDRNLAVVGRVWSGIERLSTLPRGGGAMGFYEQPAQLAPITRVRVAADLPVAERSRLEILRSDSASFATLLEARRNRRDDFYRRPAGFLDVCNALLPVRPLK